MMFAEFKSVSWYFNKDIQPSYVQVGENIKLPKVRKEFWHNNGAHWGWNQSHKYVRPPFNFDKQRKWFYS